MTDLCEIMKRHGSDKGLGWHNYTEEYHRMWSKLRGEPLNIFEIGLGTNNVNLPSNMGKDGVPGASLRGWAEYFPKANVFGADVDSDILFEEDRIKTFYCDQTNPESIHELCEKLGEVKFDIIIDDGLHEYFANRIFLDNFIHRLAKTGWYVIEDLTKDTVHKLRVNLEEILNRHRGDRELSCLILDIHHSSNNVDNCIAVIRSY